MTNVTVFAALLQQCVLLLVSLGPPAVKQVLVRYLNLGDLQTTLKLSYHGCGPQDQSCADKCLCCFLSAATAEL